MVQERIGVVMITPHLWIARRNGASFSNAKCVRDSSVVSSSQPFRWPLLCTDVVGKETTHDDPL